MAIQWYPGHMHKAQNDIKKQLNNIDLIIEVLDARIPYSSRNPAIEALSINSGNPKPRLKIINKSDLADPVTTQKWQAYFEQALNVKALSLSIQQPQQVKNISSLCLKLFPQRNLRIKPIQAMIVGIPNVGKSTIINGLASRTIAKTGNEPAITKTQQRIDLKNGIILFDTPGILWPKIENPESAYRLAITGAIKDTAIDYTDIAYHFIEFITIHYPSQLQKHYQLDEIPQDPLLVLETIGLKRGCVKSGGHIDLDKVSKIIIKDYRSGIIGKLSLENPDMIEKENKAVAILAQAKIDKKAARKMAFKNKRQR